MDDFFLANAMVFMDGLQQVQREQHQLLHPFVYEEEKASRRPSSFSQPFPLSSFPAGHFEYDQEEYEAPEFNNYEYFDLQKREGFVHCDIIEVGNAPIVSIGVQIPEGMSVEKAKASIKENILLALKQGFTHISASVGEDDIYGKTILQELGFQVREEIREMSDDKSIQSERKE